MLAAARVLSQPAPSRLHTHRAPGCARVGRKNQRTSGQGWPGWRHTAARKPDALMCLAVFQGKLLPGPACTIRPALLAPHMRAQPERTCGACPPPPAGAAHPQTWQSVRCRSRHGCRREGREDESLSGAQTRRAETHAAMHLPEVEACKCLTSASKRRAVGCIRRHRQETVKRALQRPARSSAVLCEKHAVVQVS